MTEPAIDTGEILEALNDKADRDLGNLSSSARANLSSVGMPGSTYDSITVGASGSTYTAPENGWYIISSNKEWAYIENNETGFCCSAISHSPSSVKAIGYMPVKKGDSITLTYVSSGTINWFRFYYMEGD